MSSVTEVVIVEESRVATPLVSSPPIVHEENTNTEITNFTFVLPPLVEFLKPL